MPHFIDIIHTVVTLLTTTPTLLYDERHPVNRLGVFHRVANAGKSSYNVILCVKENVLCTIERGDNKKGDERHEKQNDSIVCLSL